MASDGLKLGIFGGTFNPIHVGHLRAAEEIAGMMNLDQVLFIPVAAPPHKDASPVIEFAHRFEMTKAAVAGRPGFFVSDLEGRRGGVSYTVVTLRQLHKEKGPGLDPCFIMGLDAFFEIRIWKDYRRVFELSNIIVISRPGYNPRPLERFLTKEISSRYTKNARLNAYTCPGKKKVYYRSTTRIDISSTDIRTRLVRCESIRYLVPEKVRVYIEANGLYRSKTAPRKGEAA